MGRQIPGSRRYIVQWADDSFQEQEVLHMYGPLTRKRPLRIGDHVIALADPSKQLYVRNIRSSITAHFSYLS